MCQIHLNCLVAVTLAFVLVMFHNYVKYYPGPTTQCVHCDLGPWDTTLGRGHAQPWTMDNSCEILSRSNKAVRSNGSDTDFAYTCVNCEIDLGDMTLDQCHYTPFYHGQQLSEISRFNLALRSSSPDTDFWYGCAVTLTLEIWPCVQVMAYLLVMDNNCLKYNPDLKRLDGVLVRTRVLGMCAIWPWEMGFGYVCNLTLGDMTLGPDLT